MKTEGGKCDPVPGISATRMQNIMHDGDATPLEQRNLAIALAQRRLFMLIGGMLIHLDGCPESVKESLRQAMDFEWMESQL